MLSGYVVEVEECLKSFRSVCAVAIEALKIYR
jgi:hypothetical protein